MCSQYIIVRAPPNGQIYDCIKMALTIWFVGATLNPLQSSARLEEGSAVIEESMLFRHNEVWSSDEELLETCFLINVFFFIVYMYTHITPLLSVLAVLDSLTQTTFIVLFYYFFF